MFIFSDGNVVFALFFLPLHSAENFHICYFEGIFFRNKRKFILFWIFESHRDPFYKKFSFNSCRLLADALIVV